MSAALGPNTNLLVKLGMLGIISLIAFGGLWCWLAARTDYSTHVGWVLDQPVPFSHQHHVAGLGLDCRFCHAGVETSANAGMPPTYTCMTCHSQIWTNAKILAPLRESLAFNHPITWQRVNILPDYVYFNHSIHIAKGVGCASCHGAIDRMPLTAKAQPFSMAFCLSCHRDPAPQLRPRSAIFNVEWQRDTSTPLPRALMALYHLGGRKLTDCSICHR